MGIYQKGPVANKMITCPQNDIIFHFINKVYIFLREGRGKYYIITLLCTSLTAHIGPSQVLGVMF